MARIRLGVVEDHERTRANLLTLLSEYSDRLDVVAGFPDAPTFMRSEVKESLDVVLVDLGLPGIGGAELIRSITVQHPKLRAIALTVFNDAENVLDALASGARGFLLKDEPVEALLRAIDDVVTDKIPLSSNITRFLVDEVLPGHLRVQLTDRELEVAKALAAGASYAECASTLGITVGTVQDHVKRIYRKLDVTTKRELQLRLERLTRVS